MPGRGAEADAPCRQQGVRRFESGRPGSSSGSDGQGGDEGRFAVRNKTAGHPHTNMAKAALNMLTRTSAEALAAQGVHLCSVDTGWITDENPAPKKARIADRGFRTPLDVVDGAARVYDPIVRGEAGETLSGVFLKDYRTADW
jgi:NAD(P)-dependent dehydrogenase (short-subunit alcohol dehydrogenase family)